MKKILLIALGLLFVNGLMVAESRAQPQRRTPPGPAKITNNESLINDAFHAAFGRNATAGEIDQWKKSDLTKDDLVAKLVESLKSRAGAEELRKTIERSYPNSFGRGPAPKEIDFWQLEAKAKGYGFDGLYAAYRDWLKTPAADSERKSIVFKSCFEALGRIPNVSESNQWRDMIEKTGEAYFQMVIFTHNLLFAGNPDYEKERNGMIKRAFLTAGKPQPTDGDYKFWMPEIEKQDLTFKKLVAILRNQLRGGVKLNGEVDLAEQGREVARPSAENETSIQKPRQTQGNSRVKVINLKE